MKFIITTDIHFAYPNNAGFHTQNKYTEQAGEILKALGSAAMEQNAEFIIHAGDLTNHGSEPEIIDAVKCCQKLPVPFYTILGNHDCMQPDYEALWLKNGKSIFPEETLDTTFVHGGLRFDLLTNYWGIHSGAWIPEEGFHTRIEEHQLKRLRSGEQNIPRIIVFHSQVRPVYMRQTGWHENIHNPANGFSETGDRLIAEFHPLLIAGGHNHFNTLERINGTFVMTASSLSEAPFEYKLLEFSNGKLSMQTCSLAEYISFPFEYDKTRKFVQGETCDREFSDHEQI